MRTTISIPEPLLQSTILISGEKSFSKAITKSLEDYIRIKNQLDFIKMLYETPIPHDYKKIKKERNRKQW